jgi:hypothetical protein
VAWHGQTAHEPCLGPEARHEHATGTAREARRPGAARCLVGPPGRAGTTGWPSIPATAPPVPLGHCARLMPSSPVVVCSLDRTTVPHTTTHRSSCPHDHSSRHCPAGTACLQSSHVPLATHPFEATKECGVGRKKGRKIYLIITWHHV